MTSDGDSPMANLRRKNGRDKAWKLKYLGVGNAVSYTHLDVYKRQMKWLTD